MTFTHSAVVRAATELNIVIGKFRKHTQRGFTLIELLVVMTIISVLLTIAAPRYMRSITDAKESALKSTLGQMREALDHFNADQGQYPVSLKELVEKKYLRAIPVDPLTESAETWQLTPPPDSQDKNQIYDIRSGDSGVSRAGEPYAKW